MKRLRRKLPPIVRSRTIFASLVLAALLIFSIGDGRNLLAWAAFTSTIGFLYFLVNPLFDLGYQIEFSPSVIRQRTRGYGWLIGRQPWTEVSIRAINSMRYLEPTQSMYRESAERPVELMSHERGQTNRILIEPIAFDPVDFDELICLVERSK